MQTESRSGRGGFLFWQVVMPGLVPGIPINLALYSINRDHRDKPGDDNN